MGRRVLAISLFLAAVLAAGGTRAEGLYAAFGLGATLPRDAAISGAGINATADFNAGGAVAGAIGFHHDLPLRTEFELTYRRADVDQVSGAAGSGEANAVSGMANAFYDFQLDLPVVPYLGLGLGLASVNYDGLRPVGGSRIADRDTVIAYQGIAGLGYSVSETIGLFADYRYFATGDPDFTTDSGTAVEGEFAEHRIMVGLRFSFGPLEPRPKKAKRRPRRRAVQAPTPQPQAQPETKPQPAPAAAAPRMPRSYLIFFDFDKASLTPEAKSVVAAAAQNAQAPGATGTTRIEATGHADRAGPAAYNLKLSQRRAEEVKKELIAKGIAAGDIAVLFKGETDPMIATGDGVREAKNRRVQIILK